MKGETTSAVRARAAMLYEQGIAQLEEAAAADPSLLPAVQAAKAAGAPPAAARAPYAAARPNPLHLELKGKQRGVDAYYTEGGAPDVHAAAPVVGRAVSVFGAQATLEPPAHAPTPEPFADLPVFRG